MPAKDKTELFRKLPAVDRLLQSPAIEAASAEYPRTLILKAIQEVLEDLRERIRKEDGFDEAGLTVEGVSKRVCERLEKLGPASLRQVINATGVVIHTNLGRSPLAERVLRKFRALAGGYSNLEYDLETGQRGSRYTHVEAILKEITTAEAAMVVNNNAAAVLLCLDTLAKGREVVVSRGQLVEIGGSFRIPDVMRKSGARMVEEPGWWKSEPPTRPISRITKRSSAPRPACS